MKRLSARAGISLVVDQVPVLDLDKFKSLSPIKIKQIDVIEDVYVKGEPVVAETIFKVR